jgi:hypothetical protein
MREKFDSLKAALAEWAAKNPRLLLVLLTIAVVQPLSKCAHEVDPRAGRVFDAVAPMVATEIVDAVAESGTSSASASSSASSGGGGE